VNVGGTSQPLRVLQVERLRQVIVNITTDKCLREQEWLWVTGKTTDGGYDPYSSSKAAPNW